jgi:hypothetical protein
MSSTATQISFWSALLESPFLWLQLTLVGCVGVAGLFAGRWVDAAIAAACLYAAFWAYVVATMWLTFGLPLSDLGIPLPVVIGPSVQFVCAFLIGRLGHHLWTLMVSYRRRANAVTRLRRLSTPPPEGFKFDRDEANER